MLRKIFEFGFMTLLSRILGLVRDTLVAYVLGAQGLADVFLAAFRLPNLFRNYFAEGSLSVSFVPLYAKKLSNPKEASEFANHIFSVLFVVLSSLCIILFIFLPKILAVFTPGFLGSHYKFSLTVDLSRIMLGYLLFISLGSVIGSILQAHNCFYVTAISPIVLNLCIIISAIVPHYGLPVYYFSIAVSTAGVLQFIFSIFVAARKKLSIKLAPIKFDDADKKAFAKRSGMSILSGCMTQISIWINTVFASFVPGAVSYFYYADRVTQLPQALIGVSMSTVLLPAIARLARMGQTREMINMQNRALDLGVTLVMPAVVILTTVPNFVLLALLNYGQFDYLAITNTSPVLTVLSIALPSFVMSRILLLFFYTTGEFAIPAFAALISLFINIIFDNFIMKYYGHVGVAIGSTLASWINVILLMTYLRRRGLYHVDDALLMKLAHVFVSSAVMVVVLCAMKVVVEPFFFQKPLMRILSLVGVIASGLLAYFYTLLVVFGQKVTLTET
ncbi:murein biosynthesis integral membrane protein MurJ [Candidatus Anaplasma sp. TIGMIC]|nr:murein biosynthesis integral membrane protein MurJ [Candidatus Anaplasma sp. TIGMIC]